MSPDPNPWPPPSRSLRVSLKITQSLRQEILTASYYSELGGLRTSKFSVSWFPKKVCDGAPRHPTNVVLGDLVTNSYWWQKKRSYSWVHKSQNPNVILNSKQTRSINVNPIWKYTGSTKYDNSSPGEFEPAPKFFTWTITIVFNWCLFSFFLGG